MTDYSAVVHPEDRDALWRLYAEVEAGRDAFTAEFRILRPDGEVIWVEEIGEVERDAAGRRVAVSGTLQDVSERKRAEAALRDSEARLRGFLDHAPFAMYLKDTDLRYLLVNRAVEQFQGMTARGDLRQDAGAGLPAGARRAVRRRGPRSIEARRARHVRV